jgi:hypothetical protein
MSVGEDKYEAQKRQSRVNHVGKKYEVSSDLTIFTVIGQVTHDEIKEVINEFYEGVTSKNVLWDLNRGNFELISNEEIQDLVNIPRSQYLARKGGKTAIVAGKDLAYGMARIYEARSRTDPVPFETRIFRTIEEANQWLNSTG